MKTPWTIIWAACWASLPAARADAIEAYLSEKVEGLREGELQEAVEHLANTTADEKFGTGAPSIRTLEYTIRTRRKQKRGIDTSEPYEISQAKREIRNAKAGHDMRWDVICLIADKFGSEWAHRLERYAVANGGLLLPWFVPKHLHHPSATQEEKPEGIESSEKMLKRVISERRMNYQPTCTTMIKPCERNIQP